MNFPGKILTGLVILMQLSFYMPGEAIAGDSAVSSRDKIIIHHDPESVSTPEMDIPGGPEISKGRGSSRWLWITAAVVAVAGIAASAGGGGSGGGGGGGTGSIKVSW